MKKKFESKFLILEEIPYEGMNETYFDDELEAFNYYTDRVDKNNKSICPCEVKILKVIILDKTHYYGDD